MYQKPQIEAELHRALYFPKFENHNLKFHKNLEKEILDVDSVYTYIQQTNTLFSDKQNYTSRPPMLSPDRRVVRCMVVSVA